MLRSLLLLNFLIFPVAAKFASVPPSYIIVKLAAIEVEQPVPKNILFNISLLKHVRTFALSAKVAI